MGRYDHINSVLSAVHDAGLVGATGLELCDKHGFALNRATASLYSLWKDGAVRRSRDPMTGHYRYWYERERYAAHKPPAPVAPAKLPDMCLTFLVPIREGDDLRLTLKEARTLYKNLQAIFTEA